MKNRYVISGSILLMILLFLILCTYTDAMSRSPEMQANVSPITLWVISEQTVSDGMNYQAKQLSEQFQADNPNVTIQLDYLPTDAEERAEYLKQLHRKINSGTGPDIFLLPTSDTVITETPQKYKYTHVMPLFSNVEQAMRNGCFADISQFYDSDIDLWKEALAQKIMDAGTLGDARYVLPLRFDIPIVYVFSNDCDKLGTNDDVSEFTIEDWMEYAIKYNSTSLACGVEYASINVFSKLINYDQNIIMLSTEEVIAYFKQFSKLEEIVGNEFKHRSVATLDNISDIRKDFPVHIDPLSSSMAYAALAQREGTTLSMYPVRSIEGDVIATVSYYGAINADTNHVEICYEFLKLFLSETAQWEYERPKPETSQYEGLLEGSWPVRTVGSVKPLWKNINAQKGGYNPYRAVELTDESIDVLKTNIDIVRFPFPNNFYNALMTLHSGTNYTEYAQEFIESLKSMVQGQ